MKYWITHPNLTPAHDQQIEAGALAAWAGSGWQIREDQTDPDDSTIEPADPRPTAGSEPKPVEVVESADPREPADDTPEAPASDPEPSTTTKKKGEV